MLLYRRETGRKRESQCAAETETERKEKKRHLAPFGGYVNVNRVSFAHRLMRQHLVGWFVSRLESDYDHNYYDGRVPDYLRLTRMLMH